MCSSMMEYKKILKLPLLHLVSFTFLTPIFFFGVFLCTYYSEYYEWE